MKINEAFLHNLLIDRVLVCKIRLLWGEHYVNTANFLSAALSTDLCIRIKKIFFQFFFIGLVEKVLSKQTRKILSFRAQQKGSIVCYLIFLHLSLTQLDNHRRCEAAEMGV
jgi:hypothetical protein